MSVRVYIKRGNKNYKEKRLIADIESAIEKKLADNPDYTFVPATNFDELKTLHTLVMVEDVEFEEQEDSTTEQKDNTETMEENTEEQEVATEQETTSFDDNETSDFVDPFNREEPEVRDYVIADDPQAREGAVKSDPDARYDEPTSFNQAFDIPDAEIVEESSNSDGQQNQSQQSGESNKDNSNQSKKSDPVNPSFDSMDSGKQRKQSKKFAKYIVEAICMLSEKGFVWFANKDINDAKLAEYELNNEMDLDLLVTLEGNQEVTVKQFFQQQCLKAEELAVIGEEQKKDLADALSAVLMEKGVGPTPSQELILVAVTILGGQVLGLMTLKGQTNSLLAQLRSMKEEEAPYEEVRRPAPAPAPTPTPEPEAEPAAVEEEITEVEQYDEPAQSNEETYELESVDESGYGIIEEPISTKE